MVAEIKATLYEMGHGAIIWYPLQAYLGNTSISNNIWVFSPTVRPFFIFYFCASMHTNNSFPQHVKRESKNVAMPMPSSEIMFRKRALHKYVHIYPLIHLWKGLYQNTIFELSIGIASSFSGMVLNVFWKIALHMFCVKLIRYNTLYSILAHDSNYAEYPILYNVALTYTSRCSDFPMRCWLVF